MQVCTNTFSSLRNTGQYWESDRGLKNSKARIENINKMYIDLNQFFAMTYRLMMMTSHFRVPLYISMAMYTCSCVSSKICANSTASVTEHSYLILSQTLLLLPMILLQNSFTCSRQVTHATTAPFTPLKSCDLCFCLFNSLSVTRNSLKA